MSRKLSHQPLPDRFNHLLNVISSQRFLEMKGLNNDLPFYVCEYRPAEATDMERMRLDLLEKQMEVQAATAAEMQEENGDQDAHGGHRGPEKLGRLASAAG